MIIIERFDVQLEFSLGDLIRFQLTNDWTLRKWFNNNTSGGYGEHIIIIRRLVSLL